MTQVKESLLGTAEVQTVTWPHRVAIIGAGYMGRGIAEVLALANVSCSLADLTPERAGSAARTLFTEAERHERDGLIAPGSALALRDRVRAARSVEDATSGADYVIEAVYEDSELKASLLAEIDSISHTDVVISTNTSAISIQSLSRRLADPTRFLGVHWFNPPQFVPGVEVVPCTQTTREVTQKVKTLLLQVGKMPVEVMDSPGFVANRLQYALFQEAAAVVEEGTATAEAVDLIVRTTFGFRLPIFGPFAIADIAGLDVYRNAYKILQENFPDRFKVPRALEELVEQGRYGAKTGSGFVINSTAQAQAMAARRDRAYVALRRALGGADGLPETSNRDARAGTGNDTSGTTPHTDNIGEPVDSQ